MVAGDILQRYAEEIRANTHLTSPDLLKAFAAVPREEFVGSGPWKVLSRVPGQMQPQVADVTDPAELYRDVAILLDPSRSLTNGNPGTLAPWLDALNLSAGKSVFHLGCGTGYYTAIMAEMVGPEGRITGVEIDRGGRQFPRHHEEWKFIGRGDSKPAQFAAHGRESPVGFAHGDQERRRQPAQELRGRQSASH
jgi:protein-L-isoaspartate O-methyltransferase